LLKNVPFGCISIRTARFSSNSTPCTFHVCSFRLHDRSYRWERCL